MGILRFLKTSTQQRVEVSDTNPFPVALTGSNVLLEAIEGVTVTAGSRGVAFNNVNLSDYEAFYVQVGRLGDSHPYKAYDYPRFGNSTSLAHASVEIGSTQGPNFITGRTNVKGIRSSIYVENLSEVDQSYRVAIFGVKG